MLEAKAAISVDLDKRLGEMSEKELLIEVVRRLGQLSELPAERREGPLTIAPTGGRAIQSLGGAVGINWVARSSYRIDRIVVSASGAGSFDLRIGPALFGPFYVGVGVVELVLPLLVPAGSEVEITNGTAAVNFSAYLLGAYVK